MDALLNFDVQLNLGDTAISEEEAQRLLQASEGLAFIKNKWVAVDPDRLKQTLDAYEKAKKMMAEQGLSLKDALTAVFQMGNGLNRSLKNCSTRI